MRQLFYYSAFSKDFNFYLRLPDSTHRKSPPHRLTPLMLANSPSMFKNLLFRTKHLVLGCWETIIHLFGLPALQMKRSHDALGKIVQINGMVTDFTCSSFCKVFADYVTRKSGVLSINEPFLAQTSHASKTSTSKPLDATTWRVSFRFIISNQISKVRQSVNVQMMFLNSSSSTKNPNLHNKHTCTIASSKYVIILSLSYRQHSAPSLIHSEIFGGST